MYTNWDIIYQVIITKYGRRFIRCKEDTFNDQTIILLLEKLPSIYTSQQIFFNNQLNLLKDPQNRGSQSSSTTNSNVQANGDFKQGQGNTNRGAQSKNLGTTPTTDDSFYEKNWVNNQGNTNTLLNGTTTNNNQDFILNLEKVLHNNIFLNLQPLLVEFEYRRLFTRFVL